VVKAVSDLNFVTKTTIFDFDGVGDVLQSFRWVNLKDLTTNELTFPTDKYVAELLISSL
jgi:hypothetical protein